jgi:DNA repair photolyase
MTGIGGDMASFSDTVRDDGGAVRKPLCPVIISASRATDIPAFYSDWLIGRIRQGYLKWKNPFNGEYSYVSFDKARLFVFWTKNPRPLIDKLEFFDDHGFNYYFQFTLNNYDAERWEPGLPSVQARIDTFLELADKIGKEKVIWRFDPIIVSQMLYPDQVLDRIRDIGDQIHAFTERLVFSFIDVECYRKVKNNLSNLDEAIRDIDLGTMDYLAHGIADLNKKWGLALGTCAEKVDLEKHGIEHNRCIDDRLIIKLFPEDTELMKYLGVDAQQLFLDLDSLPYSYDKIKDKGQRKACGCIQSKDIGQYDTCPHGCVYCYANTNPDQAKDNHLKTNQDSEMLL